MAKFRRRARGTWFPVISDNIGTEEGTDVPAWGFSTSIDLDSSGVANPMAGADIRPVTFDVPKENFEPSNVDESLNDIIGNEYFLRRIVGKFAFTTATSKYSMLKVAAGFFVGRAGSDGTLPNALNNANVALGPSSTPEDLEGWKDYSPLSASTIREPWIWRRTWLVEPTIEPQSQPVNYTLLNPRSLPASNTLYGSVLDGPHLDAKTKRRVTQDERLWFAWAACFFPYQPAPDSEQNKVEASVIADLDIRIYASLRKARNRGVF